MRPNEGLFVQNRYHDSANQQSPPGARGTSGLPRLWAWYRAHPSASHWCDPGGLSMDMAAPTYGVGTSVMRWVARRRAHSCSACVRSRWPPPLTLFVLRRPSAHARALGQAGPSQFTLTTVTPHTRYLGSSCTPPIQFPASVAARAAAACMRASWSPSSTMASTLCCMMMASLLRRLKLCWPRECPSTGSSPSPQHLTHCTRITNTSELRLMSMGSG